MDSTALNHISLCTGYGGIDLGLSRVLGDRVRTVAYSEIEAFACANLVAKMEAGLLDPAPIWTDLKTFPWEKFRGLVDILSGGYPCQPFSAAGKRAGKDDPRHLWPWIADGIAILRPRFCFFENVEGHVTLGLRDVIEDLGRMGYRTTWSIFSAAEVGAPHQRKRVFILADRDGSRGWEDLLPTELRPAWPKQSPGSAWPGGGATEGREVSGGLADSDSDGVPRSGHKLGGAGESGQRRANSSAHCHAIAWPSRPGEPQHGWEPPRVVDHATMPRQQAQWNEPVAKRRAESVGESGQRQVKPPLGRDSHGTPNRLDDAELYVTCDNRTDELRLLGNGVVPATAERAFRVLMAELALP